MSRSFICFLLVAVALQFPSTVCQARKKTVIDVRKSLMDKGDSCMQAFDSYHASVYYRQLYDSVPDVCVIRKLSDAYRNLGRNKDCASLLRTLPEDSVGYHDLRSLYFAYRSMENTDSLLYYGDSILRMNPYDGEIVVSMASYCNGIAVPRRAAGICRSYMRNDSTNMLVLRQLGYASYLLGEYEEAYRSYRQLEAEGFDNYESAFIMGVSLEKMGREGNAYDYFQKATRHKGDKDYQALASLGRTGIAIGLYDEGISCLRKAMDILVPDSNTMASLYRDMAEAFYLKHDYAEAARAFERSSSFSPDNPITYYNIAQMYGAVGDKRKERRNYSLFLQNSGRLKDTEENKELVEKVRELLEGF